MRRLFVKILANLTHRIVSNQAGRIKQGMKHQALSLLPKTIEGLHSTGFLRQTMMAFKLLFDTNVLLGAIMYYNKSSIVPIRSGKRGSSVVKHLPLVLEVPGSIGAR